MVFDDHTLEKERACCSAIFSSSSKSAVSTVPCILKTKQVADSLPPYSFQSTGMPFSSQISKALRSNSMSNAEASFT